MSLLKFNQILEKLDEGFFVLDKKWCYIEINKKGLELAGKTKKELVGKVWFKLYPDIKSSPFFKAAKDAMEKQVTTKVEAFYPPFNKWYQTTFYPVDDGIVGFSRDVTKQRQLSEFEKYFKAIIDSSDDAIISKNLNSIITSWNKAAERMFGYKSEEAVGQPIYIIIPPELHKEEPIIIRTLKKGKRIDHFETERVRKDGTRIRVSVTISPIINEDGKVIGASKVARDVTQERRIEENLKFLSEASKILASSLDYNTTLQKVAKIAIPHIADWTGVDILSSEGDLKQVAVWHKEPKKVAWAKAYRRANPPDMNSENGVPQVIKTGQAIIYPQITDEMLIQAAKNKKELELARNLHMSSAMIVPIKVREQTIGAISFVTTGTRHPYNDGDLAMAEEVASRASLAIENARLYQEAQKEIEMRKKIEKQKDDFIGVASHELKTPVTSIKSFAQVLKLKFAKEGNTQAADLLGKLDAQVDKLTNLIGDLLDVTKIEAGRMQFNEDYFAFDELVDELIEELQRTTDKHTLAKEGQTRKKIMGDRERLGQVITNLISNAIKYSPYSNKIIIHLSTGKGKVKLAVQDFGIGIAKDKQTKVFERFFRASGPSQETYPGLGLGLYVSSEIIKRLGGKIWVDSTEGKGSTFYFELPIRAKTN